MDKQEQVREMIHKTNFETVNIIKKEILEGVKHQNLKPKIIK